MIASWMLFALALSVLLAVAGFAAERVAKAYGRATRFVWVVTIALSVVWPLAPIVARLLPAPPRPVRVLPFTIVVAAPAAISADEAAAMARALLVDRLLVALWIALSLILVARLVRSWMALRASQRGWRRGRVNGVRVKVSDNVGPAVVGLRTMDVVVPEWILALDEPLRAIVLRHEEEHRNARDPHLLFGATVLVALMPWNVALWLQARRLRLAIEVDCDARVLRAHPSPERYGMLILTIAQRRSVAPVQFAPMLSEPRTNLERRILAMRTTKAARVTVIGGSLVAVGVLALASTLQSAPVSLERTRAAISQRFVAALPSVPAPAETIPVVTKRPANDRQEVRRLESVVTSAGTAASVSFRNPAPQYPDLLRSAEIEGAVIARFAYDASGMVDPSSITILTSTHDLLAKSVRTAVAGWRGAPGTSAQVPFVFVLDNKSGKDLSAYPGGLPAGSMVVTAPPVRGGAVVAGEAQSAPRLMNENTTYFEFQVEQPVTPMPGNPAPRYPDALREAGVEGEVLAQFVVGPDGVADMSTFKVLKSTHADFTAAVQNALVAMKFNPPRVGGREVKQLVQMPFQFNLAKTP